VKALCVATIALALVSTTTRADTLKAKIESRSDVDDLVKNLRKQLDERGHELDVVIDGTHDVRIVGIAEESISGAQGTIVVLSPTCEVLVAVTRSGRMTVGGAFNAASKEVAKRLEAIGLLRPRD
jgi:hypothetical protein